MFNFINWMFIYLLLIKAAHCNDNVQTLKLGEVEQCHRNRCVSPKIYCLTPQEKSVFSVWRTVQINISLNSNEYIYYKSNSLDELKQEIGNHNSYLSVLNIIMPSTIQHSTINPFKEVYIAISTDLDYSFSFVETAIDYRLFFIFMVGLIFFVFSDSLSRSQYFHYSCGIAFGMILALLLPLYLIIKQIKNKTLFYGSAVFSWFTGFYFLNVIFNNVQLLLVEYSTYVFSYVFISGLTSFLLCYRFGPVTNERTKNIIKWMLLVAGITLIYFSSYLNDVTSLVVILLIILRLFPFGPFKWLLKTLSNFWYRSRPVYKRLSMEEYQQQTAIETPKNLMELRKYCSSPDANAWKIISNLNDPKRFAKFVQGDSDVSVDEKNEFENMLLEISDDE